VKSISVLQKILRERRQLQPAAEVAAGSAASAAVRRFPKAITS
jgi:hypothetical protein